MSKTKSLLRKTITLIFCIMLITNTVHAYDFMDEQVISENQSNSNENSMENNDVLLADDTTTSDNVSNDEMTDTDETVTDEMTDTDKTVVDDKTNTDETVTDEMIDTDELVNDEMIDTNEMSVSDEKINNEIINTDETVKDMEANTDDINQNEEKLKKINNINEYLENLDSKELSKEIKNLSKEQLQSYLKEVKGYSDLQIEGKKPIINENGNLYFYSDYRLNPYLPTISGIDKLKSIDNKKNKYDSVKHRSISETEIPSKIDPRLEIPSMRDENSKHYKMEDGNYIAEISPTPIHYLDGDEYKDIDVIIRNNSNNSFEYSNLENSFKTYFNSCDSLDNNVISKYIKLNKNGTERQLEFMIENANPTHETLDENKIRYHNVFPNVDIEYQINPVRLKENIYISEPVTDINYEFLLKVDGVVPKQNDSLDIEFIDEDTNEVIWIMKRPYAEDSGINQLITKDMHYDVESVQIDGEDMVKLVLVMDDPMFLANASYPIVIDPTIFPSMSDIRMIITDSYEGYGFENEHHIYGFPNGPSQEHRVYMNFNLSTIPANSIIKSSQLKITPMGALGYEIPCTYTCRRLLSDFSNANWYNKPAVTTTNEAKWTSDKPADTKFFFIQDIMNDAMKDGQFYGFEISGDRNKQTGFYTDIYHEPVLYIDYSVNIVPKITSCTVSDYYVIRTERKDFAIQIHIEDDTPSNLKTDFYINGVKKETKNGKVPWFVIDFTKIPDGICNLKFVVSDGLYTTEKIVPVKLDCHSPTINNVQVSSTDTSINVSVSATDEGYSLPSLPYCFGIDGVMRSYSSNRNTTFTGLQPASTHTINIKVRDESDQVTEESRVVTTKAQIPTLIASNIKSNEMTINLSDNNNVSTEYLIKFNNKYVSANGILSDSPQWITLTNKSINVKSLDRGNSYLIKVKARNKDHIETNFSSVITASTKGDVPAVIQNLDFAIQNNIVFNWDAISDAEKYDIEINGNVTRVTKNQYILENAQLNLNYKVRIRGINNNGNGEWCDYFDFTPSKNVAFQTINV